MNGPLGRTADAVSEINVLVAQAWIFNSLSDEEKAVQIADDPQAAEEQKNSIDAT